MLGYSGIDGQKWETEEDIFDQIGEMLRLFDTTDEPPLQVRPTAIPTTLTTKND